MKVRLIVELETHLSRRIFNRCVSEALLPGASVGDLFVPSAYGTVTYIATEDAETHVLSHDGKTATR